MHTYSKDYVVHHHRICVRYACTVPRHILINYIARTSYGPRGAIESSKGDDPKAFYVNNKETFYFQNSDAYEDRGAAKALLLLPLKLRSGWRGPYAACGFSVGKRL